MNLELEKEWSLRLRLEIEKNAAKYGITTYVKVPYGTVRDLVIEYFENNLYNKDYVFRKNHGSASKYLVASHSTRVQGATVNTGWLTGKDHTFESTYTVTPMLMRDSVNFFNLYFKEDFDKYMTVKIKEILTGLFTAEGVAKYKSEQDKAVERKRNHVIDKFNLWTSKYDGLPLSSKRKNELKEIKDKYIKVGLKWSYIHKIRPRKFKIDYKLEDFEDYSNAEDKLSKILEELGFEDDGESMSYKDVDTTLEIEMYDDGFTITGSTKKELGSMRIRRIGMEFI